MNKPRATVQSTSSKATINSPIRTQRSQATGLRDPVKPSKQASSRSHAIVPNSSALSEIMWEAIRHGVKNGPRSTILSMVERWKSNRLILYPKSIDCDNLVQISLQQKDVHGHKFVPILTHSYKGLSPFPVPAGGHPYPHLFQKKFLPSLLVIISIHTYRACITDNSWILNRVYYFIKSWERDSKKRLLTDSFFTIGDTAIVALQ